MFFRRRTVRVAALTRPQEHHSLRRYRDALFTRLPGRGIELMPFAPGEPAPASAQLLWDPALGMREVPELLWTDGRPVVATVLGLRSFALPPEQFGTTPAEIDAETARRDAVRAGWERVRPRLAAVISISRHCADSVVEGLGVPRALVRAVHLAVEKEVFTAGSRRNSVPRDYFFHVSLGGRARKNLDRMLAAYNRLPRDARPGLVIKLQDAPSGDLPAGVRIITGHCDDAELARWYRGARALVFPSVYEGFGLPILEAMCCGCPVITANGSACREVAGDAALLVDPYSTDELAAALERLSSDAALAARLSAAGLRRARDFSWDRCAAEHARILRESTGRTL